MAAISDEVRNCIKESVEEGQNPQTFWFQVCTAFMGVFVLIFVFIFLEIWNANKQQDSSLANLNERFAVVNNDAKHNSSRLDKLERVVFKEE